VLFVRGSHVAGALLVLLGAVAAVVSIVSDREEGIWETLVAWFGNLP
jgi:hypothetical protein